MFGTRYSVFRTRYLVLGIRYSVFDNRLRFTLLALTEPKRENREYRWPSDILGILDIPDILNIPGILNIPYILDIPDILDKGTIPSGVVGSGRVRSSGPT